MWMALCAAGALPALFNLHASWRVGRAIDYTREQKVLQLLLIWLIPVFGVIAVYMMLTALHPKAAPRDARLLADPFTPDLGDNHTWSQAGGSQH